MENEGLVTFTALGTTWWIELFDEVDETTRGSAKGTAASCLSTFEAMFSRFLPHSLLSQLNRDRIITNPPPLFIETLSYGQALYAKTGGIFNLLIGDTMTARGYTADYRFIPSGSLSTPVYDPREVLSITPIAVILRAGSLDIGGFGKGYVIDIMAQQLRRLGVHHFLINGGGDLYVTSEHGAPITIHLEHPTEAGISLGSVQLFNQGFAASSPFKRSWQHKSKLLSHIMLEDGNVPDVATFVVAQNARDADAFATTCTLTDEATSLSLAKRANLSVARYSPDTNQLWRTPGFVL